MFGWLSRRKKRDEASYTFVNIGFHGDRHLLEFVDDLVTRERIECFIETGTNVGSTLVYLAKRYPHVQALSCEADAEASRRARRHAQGLANVEIHNLPSHDFLDLLTKRPEIFKKRCLFWLDAHGYGFEWPLREEVRFVAERFAVAYMMIDDFQVPGIDGFRYDEYQGQVCSYEHIHDMLGSRPHQLFLPTYTDRTSSHHPLTGWGLVVMGAEYSVPETLRSRVGRAR
jgi:hypothetical protein